MCVCVCVCALYCEKESCLLSHARACVPVSVITDKWWHIPFAKEEQGEKKEGERRFRFCLIFLIILRLAFVLRRVLPLLYFFLGFLLSVKGSKRFVSLQLASSASDDQRSVFFCLLLDHERDAIPPPSYTSLIVSRWIIRHSCRTGILSLSLPSSLPSALPTLTALEPQLCC